MGWPLSQDYNEAIQNPAGSFQDADLRAGEAATNALGLPQTRSGNFADVYEMRCPNGRFAVKCFTREVAGLQDRYRAISEELVRAKLPFTVDFTYLPQGIRVRGQWYPVLKMQWVEGLLLNEFVRNNLDKPALLTALGQIWVRMSQRLHDAGIAHGDLQHGNVILVPGSKAASLALKLIDYDGMHVPALANKKPGEVGHPCYQHPQRIREGIYTSAIDRTPQLVVVTALRALALGGKALWDRHDNGDNLLFREADLQRPAESKVLRELWNLPDAGVHDLTGQLALALAGPLAGVPLLHEQITEDRVRPLTAEQEAKVTELLGAGAKVKRTQPAAPRPKKAAVTESDEAEEFQGLGRGPKKASAGRQKRRGPAPALLIGGAVGGIVLIAVAVLVVVLALRRPPEPVQPIAEHKPDVKPTVVPTKTPAPTPTPKTVDPPNTVDLPKKDPRPEPKVDPQRPPPPVVVTTPRLDPDAPVGEAFRVDRPATARSVAVSDDGKHWLSGHYDQALRLWDWQTGQELWSSTGHQKWVTGVAISPDGKLGVSGGSDRCVFLWDLDKKAELACFTKHTDVIWGVALSNDQNWAASGGIDRVVRLWDVKNKSLAREFQASDPVLGVAISPQSDLVAAGTSGTNVIHVWDRATKAETHRLQGHSKEVFCVRFSPDGKRLLSSSTDGTIKLWDLKAKRALRQFVGHQGAVISAAFSSDGRRIVSGGADATVRIWDTETGQELQKFEGHTINVESVAFHPYGNHVLSSSGDKTIRYWHLPPYEAPKPKEVVAVTSVYLADVPTVEARGVGPIGEGLIGTPLNLLVKLNGILYPLGLGAEPAAKDYSLLKYKLDGTKSFFTAVAAIADSGREKITPLGFSVLGDGKVLWKTSRRLDGKGKWERCLADIRGVKILELKVECLGLAEQAHAVWLDPQLLATSPTEVEAKLGDNPQTYLADLPELEFAGPIAPGKGRIGVAGNLITVAGVTYPRALGIHPADNSSGLVRYKLGGMVKSFKARVALDDSAAAKVSPIHFQVIGDDQVLWESRMLDRPGAMQECAVDTTGVKELTLLVYCLGSWGGAHAVWLDPVLSPNPLEAPPAKSPAGPNRGTWDSLNIAQAQRMGDYLLLRSGIREIGTKKAFAGPVDITLEAKTLKNNIRIHAGTMGRLILNWEGKLDELRVHRCDGTKGPDSGSYAGAPFRPLAPDTWHIIRWKVWESGMEVLVDGETVFRDGGANNLQLALPVRVVSVDSDLGIRSLRVTPLKR